MADVKENRKPYSYHTFMFPFVWNNNNSRWKFLKREQFLKCIDKKLWKPEVYLRKDNNIEDEFIHQFNQYRYFNSAARNAIYSTDGKKSIVYNFRYDLAALGKSYTQEYSAWLAGCKGSDNPARYVIKKGDESVTLAINGIRLKLFNTGIGILVFELENYDYPTLDAFNWINDRGRRIYMPYLTDEKTCPDCADEIAIEYAGNTVVSSNLTEKDPEYNCIKLIEPITYFLKNGDYSVTTNKKEINSKTFYIEPIIDDRMFVAGYCVDTEAANKLTSYSGNGYCYMGDASARFMSDKENCANKWYCTVFVDGNGEATCRNQDMLAQMISKHTYTRWTEYGSLTGISEYSMVTLTSADLIEYYHLARNFLTEYVEMMILVLAQRASLLAFERMISDSSIGKRDIGQIQKRYIEFQSQLLLKEVTPQQQGIELYKMLIENLFIEEQSAEIEKQIEALAVQKASKSENRENLILFLIGVLGIFETINCFGDWIDSDVVQYGRFIISGVFVLISTILFFAFKRK